MGQIVMSNTEQIPAGYHLATEEERQCLPPGSKYINRLGELTDSLDVGGEGSQRLTYICPDAPSVIAFVKNLVETWEDAPAPEKGLPPIPAGYHLATAGELKCLPPGSKYFHGGKVLDSAYVGTSSASGYVYICPDAPVTEKGLPPIPAGYHLATAKERQCLPKGSKYLGDGWQEVKHREAVDGFTYICPDAPAPLSAPPGYHLATAKERKSLPEGTKYFSGSGDLIDSDYVGERGVEGFDYICPDAPAPNMEPFGVPHEPKSGWPSPSVTTPLDPKRAAGALKPQLQLIPPVFNELVAAALSHGADKYGPWNWRENKVEMMTYLGAMKRHIDALLDGEDLAPDSGVHHLGHIAASCAIVLDAGKHGTLVDNRPPQKS